MEEEKQLTSRIMEIASGVALVGDNDFLDGKVAYRLGRLGDHCKGVVREYNKQKEKIQKEGREQQKKLLEEMKAIGTDEARKEKTREIDDISIRVQTEIGELDNESVEPKIVFPDLKLSDFIAKHDINKEVNGQKIHIKTGQSLVPVRFFTLMGDLIKDDKTKD